METEQITHKTMTRAAEAYHSNLDHLLDELSRLDLALERAVSRARTEKRSIASAGSYVSEEEVRALLAKGPDRETPGGGTDDDELDRRIEQHEEEIRKRIGEGRKNKVLLRLPRLARIFGLSRFEMDVLVLCLAPELDLKYRRLYGYLHDDVTKRHPSVALVIKLFCRSIDEEIRARECFGASGALVRYRLITVLRDEIDPEAPLPAKQIKIDDGIARYLLNDHGLDPAIAHAAVLTEPADLHAGEADDIQRRIVDIARACLDGEGDRRVIFYFYGADRQAMTMTAETVCRETGSALLRAEVKALVGNNDDAEQPVLRVLREGILQSAAILLENYDSLWERDSRHAHQVPALQGLIGEMGWLVFLTGKRPWPNRGMREDQVVFEFEFPVPSAGDRKRFWESALERGCAPAGDADIEGLSAAFRLTRGQIHDAAIVARNRALLRDGRNPVITGEDLRAAARSCSNRNLASFGRKIVPRFGWEDIVLRPDTVQQMREFCQHARHRARVYGEWAFGRKHGPGTGLTILFSGDSGTGKTMAAQIVASELGLDLYKIDLSTVVSKYIGETEKNLGRIFGDAETSNAILFFDEADALFGKRTEIRDSHDRYANIEVNYLLQRLEEHQGIVVLATNLNKNMDDAFMRRLHYAVSFPAPEREERLLIWKRAFPSEAPLAADVDLPFLARQLSLTGGNIKNIALRAAFLAAADSGTIHMEHIIRASKREFQKMGRLCLEAEFRQYHELVR